MISKSRDHLREANERYFAHQAVAFRYSMRCFKAGLMARAHSVVPGWVTTRASDEVKKLAANRKFAE
jgi:hypothetical protein